MKTDSLQQFVKLHRQLSEERSTLQARLRQIEEALGTLSPVSLAAAQGASPAPKAAPAAGGKRKMSAEGRARIAAAQRARWAAQRGESAPAATASESSVGKPKRKMSAAARRAISEAAKKRWAAAKSAGKSRL